MFDFLTVDPQTMAIVAETFEIIMILCFGFSWPISIIKTLKAKTAAGKSPLFIILIITGYIFGIVSKIISDNIGIAFIFYCINLCTTSFDLALQLYYRKKDALKKKEE